MISKIPRSLKVSSFGSKIPLFTSQCTVHVNFSTYITQQKRFYDRKENESENNENLFIPPTHYPKGILRTNIDKRDRLGGEIVLSASIWQAIKRTSKRGALGKLTLVLGFFVAIGVVFFLLSVVAIIKNNLTITLQDAEKLSEADLISAVEYYTARDFPRILAGHPIFNYSSPIVLQQHSALAEVIERDTYGFCKNIKSKFSLPPSLDIQLFFSTEILPNYVAREPTIGGAINLRHEYEYLLHFNKIILYFVKEKKSQVIPKTDKFFPKRNILSAAHYQYLFDEFYKKTKMDEAALDLSRGEIQQDTESKMIEREIELQKQDKAIKDHQDSKKR